MTQKELDRRSAAAKEALRIVRKFPQIDQQFLAPALACEIGTAILRAQETTAIRCAEIADAWVDWYKPGVAVVAVSKDIAKGILREFFDPDITG
jgi:hypothetical protein